MDCSWAVVELLGSGSGVGVFCWNSTEERLAGSFVQKEMGLFPGRRNGMPWSWGMTGNYRGPPYLLHNRPCCAAAIAVGSPQLGYHKLCVYLSHVTCTFSFSSVISMRCMVQFVGREAKYRWVILRMGRSGPITIQSLPGQAVLGHSLPFSVLILMYWLQRNVVVASMVCVHEHFLFCISCLGRPGSAWMPCRGRVSVVGVSLIRSSDTRADSAT